MTGGDEDVGIDKSTDVCIVISALQIIKPGLSVVYVTTIGQGVGYAEGICHSAGSGKNVTPSVVGVFYNCGSIGIEDCNDIALKVGNVIIYLIIIRYCTIAEVESFNSLAFSVCIGSNG